MIYPSRFSRGQSILEAIILVTIVVVFVTGVFLTLTVVRTSSQYAKRRSVATQYAQEAMETLRGLRDVDTNYFLALIDPSVGGPTCFDKPITSVKSALHSSPPPCDLIDGIYDRKITFTDDVTLVAIKVTVAWQEASKLQTITLESKLAKKE